jgi:steroid 5-alpha reductase family enzyme
MARNTDPFLFPTRYGLSVAAQAVGIWFALLSSQVWIPTTMVLHLAGTVLYGTRLGMFLYIRSVTWPEWNARAKNAPEAKASTIPQKLAIITVCSLLYASMCSPLLWHAQCANSVPGGQVPIVIAGLSAQWCGFLLETVADHQKSEYKKNVHKSNDNRWCAVGLYETCRHPNYLGEILFWVGLFIAGVPAMLCKGWWSFAPAVVGLLFIVNLMTSVSKKQDEKQKARYENDAAYEQWVARTGSLLPKLW